MSVAAITDLRLMLADVLAPAGPADWPVIPYAVDSGSPPLLMLRWGDPMLEADGQCRYTGQLEVWAFTSHNDPASGTVELEAQISRIVRILAGDLYPWRVTVNAPHSDQLGGIAYYAAAVIVTAETVPNPEV